MYSTQACLHSAITLHSRRRRRRHIMGLCCTKVDQGAIGIIERWGKYNGIAHPGCVFFNPFCAEGIAGYLSSRQQQINVECETKTKDNVFVHVVVSVQYVVVPGSEHDAFYMLTNTKQQVTAYVFDVVRAVVPRIILDDVFTQKQEIANSIKVQLSRAMASFGYEIVNALVTDITPNQKVKHAMNEINAAARQRVAAGDKAEAEKILVVKAAEADAEGKYLQGVGVARQRKAIVDGLTLSISAFQGQVPGTSERDVMDMMMLTQYFDMLRDVGTNPKVSSVFLAQSTNTANDAASPIADQVREGALSAAAASSTMVHGNKHY